MASSINGKTSNFPRLQQGSSCRPMLLKDFLRDENSYQYSNELRLMYSKKGRCKSTASSKSNDEFLLVRSWSRKAAAIRLSAFHKVIKFLRIAKSPPSMDLSRGDSVKSTEDEVKVKVKVKDILRLRSFRDGAEDLTFRGDEDDDEDQHLAENCGLGTNGALLMNNKGDWSMEDCEQQSPVSVLDGSPFQKVPESSMSPFHQALASFGRTKCVLTERIQEFENNTKPKPTHKDGFGAEGTNVVDVKARRLLNNIKEDGLIVSQHTSENMILDFFVHELSISGKIHDPEFHDELMEMAKSWITGEYDDESYLWEVEDKRKAYVKDMENGVYWNKFEQEQEDVSMEIAAEVFDELIDDVLADFLDK
ncbi:polyamine oxidase 1 [Striga asiatica]|uniref:Polyamine oxidase 1 n=1 Tax=Striga asiatica TaxID=4170 RepID=A0A5A7PEB1_STRAF|nr:polyamine oxidase 1 [Striga asiatica]